MNFMKSLRLVLLGVAMAATTLLSVEPASALGGCGPTVIAMRGADAYGAIKTKTGACERRAIAPLTWAVEYGAASGDASGSHSHFNSRPASARGFFFAPWRTLPTLPRSAV